jgi:hypothetical protein
MTTNAYITTKFNDSFYLGLGISRQNSTRARIRDTRRAPTARTPPLQCRAEV